MRVIRVVTAPEMGPEMYADIVRLDASAGTLDQIVALLGRSPGWPP